MADIPRGIPTFPQLKRILIMSAANLDKSLDDIISTNSNAKRNTKRRQVNAKKAKGTAGVAKAKKVEKGKKAVTKAADAVLANPVSLARRIIVSNLPQDVDEKQVKELFQSTIGGVDTCQGSFTSNGRSTGSYTVTFRKRGTALKALQRYHGVPIDGGKLKMQVNVLVDTAVPEEPVKSLAQRLSKTPGNTASDANKPKAKQQQQPKAKAARRRTQNRSNKKAPKPQDKSAADLDAEMADYFGTSGNNEEISV